MNEDIQIKVFSPCLHLIFLHLFQNELLISSFFINSFNLNNNIKNFLKLKIYFILMIFQFIIRQYINFIINDIISFFKFLNDSFIQNFEFIFFHEFKDNYQDNFIILIMSNLNFYQNNLYFHNFYFISSKVHIVSNRNNEFLLLYYRKINQ